MVHRAGNSEADPCVPVKGSSQKEVFAVCGKIHHTVADHLFKAVIASFRCLLDCDVRGNLDFFVILRCRRKDKVSLWRNRKRMSLLPPFIDLAWANGEFPQPGEQEYSRQAVMLRAGKI